MSQSLEILNCDEELIFMDNLRSGDIDNMVSGAGGGEEEEGKKPDGIPSENSAVFTNLLAFSSARTNNLKRVKWKRFISREYLLAFSLFVMYLKRLSDDKVAVCMGGGMGAREEG